jgi:aspartate/tyrosine/aromatic aminotransferase
MERLHLLDGQFKP